MNVTSKPRYDIIDVDIPYVIDIDIGEIAESLSTEQGRTVEDEIAFREGFNECFYNLSKKHRRALYLVAMGYKNSEIAKDLGISYGWTTVLIHRAKETLWKSLVESGLV